VEVYLQWNFPSAIAIFTIFIYLATTSIMRTSHSPPSCEFRRSRDLAAGIVEKINHKLASERKPASRMTNLSYAQESLGRLHMPVACGTGSCRMFRCIRPLSAAVRCAETLLSPPGGTGRNRQNRMEFPCWLIRKAYPKTESVDISNQGDEKDGT